MPADASVSHPRPAKSSLDPSSRAFQHTPSPPLTGQQLCTIQLQQALQISGGPLPAAGPSSPPTPSSRSMKKGSFTMHTRPTSAQRCPAGDRACQDLSGAHRPAAALCQLLLRVPPQAGPQELPGLHHPQHPRQAHPLHCVGQGPAVPAPVRQVCSPLCHMTCVIAILHSPGQAHPLRRVGQGPAVPAPVWQVSGLHARGAGFRV